MSKVYIRNKTSTPFPLPFPFAWFLVPGRPVTVTGFTVAEIVAKLGGAENCRDYVEVALANDTDATTTITADVSAVAGADAGKFQGTAVDDAAPAAGEALVYDGTSYTPTAVPAVGDATSGGSSHTHAFTGTAFYGAETVFLSGTGFTTVGQTVTTTETTFTSALNDFVGAWLITATQPPCRVMANTAVVTPGALVLTVAGLAPTTAAEAWYLLRAPTPVGSIGAESAHTHTLA